MAGNEGRMRVVVTGMGTVSPVGLDVASSWAALVAGQSGVSHITRFDTDGYDSRVAGEIKGFQADKYMDRKEARRLDPYAQYAIAATTEALADAKFTIDSSNAERVGVIMGSGIGGMHTITEGYHTLFYKGQDRVSPFFIPMMIANMASGQIAIQFGARGTNFCVVSACATGGHALGEGAEIIRRGEADVMIVGGSEAPILPIGVAGFGAMKALSTGFNDQPTRASRPFDARHDGFVIAEGSAVVILESEEHARARGAHIYADFTGYGSTDDAHHIVQPDETGQGAVRAMQWALRRAGLTPGDIGYINAHGTSTKLNDNGETNAVKKLFDDLAYSVPMSSTKSMTGHMLGAAGAFEAIVGIKAMNDGIMPPTINFETGAPGCDLDYIPNTARKAELRHVMSNSFGFGGHNVTLIFSKYA